MVTRSLRPAVLALQGSVEPHVAALRELGHQATEVRKAEQLDGVTHLIVPGGESTTLHNLLDRFGIWEPLQAASARQEIAVFGTCAGAILLGRRSEERPPRLGVCDVEVHRNAYGRQLDSFVAEIQLEPPFADMNGVFIRAPRFGELGESVTVLGRHAGEPVLVQFGRHLLAAFHPELTQERQLHEYFLTL